MLAAGITDGPGTVVLRNSSGNVLRLPKQSGGLLTDNFEDGVPSEGRSPNRHNALLCRALDVCSDTRIVIVLPHALLHACQ
jgi:hypothetical protein